MTGFVSGRNRRLRGRRQATLRLHAADGDAAWLVRERVTGHEAADTTVSGAAASLYLALWHRAPWTGLTVTGNDAIADQWVSCVHVRWS